MVFRISNAKGSETVVCFSDEFKVREFLFDFIYTCKVNFSFVESHYIEGVVHLCYWTKSIK
jgi:hypothetical protein